MVPRHIGKEHNSNSFQKISQFGRRGVTVRRKKIKRPSPARAEPSDGTEDAVWIVVRLDLLQFGISPRVLLGARAVVDVRAASDAFNLGQLLLHLKWFKKW